jgi:hypothetical protein
MTSVDSDAEQPKSPKAEEVPGGVEPGKMLGPETKRVLRAGENPSCNRGDVSTFFPSERSFVCADCVCGTESAVAKRLEGGKP